MIKPPEGTRSVRIEVAGHVVDVSGPETLRAVKEAALELFRETEAEAKRIPLGFGTSQPQTERLPEPVIVIEFPEELQ